MPLTFEPDTHRYTLDGEVVPSVTGILRAAGLIDFSRIPPSILAAAQERGRVVHQAIHYHNEHDLDVDVFRATFPDYAGYFEGWLAFLADRRFTSHFNEYRIASRRRRVAGTLDCLGVLDGHAALLDFATGDPDDVAKDLQTAAYLSLAREWADTDPELARFLSAHPIVRRYAVRLTRGGTAIVEAYAAPTDFREFDALVEAYHVVARRKPHAAMVLNTIGGMVA